MKARKQKTYSVVMVVAKGISEPAVNASVGFGRCIDFSKGTHKKMQKKRTDDALPEKIALALRGVGSRELPVNLIFDVTHGNESGDDTSPATRLD
jgi:hypothetical protein